MKNIKDYLHLYLGCQVLCPKQIGWIHSQKTATLTLYFWYHNNDKKLTPILRPLSDIKEDERMEIMDILGLVYSEYIILALKDKTIYKIDLKNSFELTRFLLLKGFDLFGLIDDGLALDATKIKNP